MYRKCGYLTFYVQMIAKFASNNWLSCFFLELLPPHLIFSLFFQDQDLNNLTDKSACPYHTIILPGKQVVNTIQWFVPSASSIQLVSLPNSLYGTMKI